MSYEYFASYQIPISVDDLERVESIVREHELICAFVPDGSADPYRCVTWREQAAHHGTEVCALFDRNVLVDVLSLVRPALARRHDPCEERGRTGAALMAFLQCSNVVIDPGMALYENPDRAKEELSLFRRADNVRATIYAELALGRLQHLPPETLPAAPEKLPEVNFHQHLKGRRNLLIGLLKVANLDLSTLAPAEKMKAFFRWSHSEFLFLTPVILFAGAYFTPRRKSPLLKDLRSADRRKALSAVNNALWDMQVIVEWTRRVRRHQDGNRYWILCSRDRALKAIAREILYDDDTPDAGMVGLRAYFNEHWDGPSANEIVTLAEELDNDRMNPQRRANQPVNQAFVDGLVRDLTADLMAWNA